MRLRTVWALGGLALLALAGAAAAEVYWVVQPMPNLSGEVGADVQHAWNTTWADVDGTGGTVDVVDIDGPVAGTSVPPGSMIVVPLPAAPLEWGQSTLHNKSLRVETTGDLRGSIHSSMTGGLGDDAAFVTPESLLGMDHLIATYDDQVSPSHHRQTAVTVLATQDDTRVTIVPTGATLGGGVPINLSGETVVYVLDAFEVVTLHSGFDLSGSRVQADKPVAVWSGNVCTRVGASACDPIFEQVPSVASGGRRFVVCTSAVERGLGYDEIHTMALTNGTNGKTTVQLGPNGPSRVLDGAGAWTQWRLSTDALLIADHPILVTQFMGGSTEVTGYGVGDPSMFIVRPIEAAFTQWVVPTVPGILTPGEPAAWNRILSVAGPLAATVAGPTAGTWRPIPETGMGCMDLGAGEGIYSVTGSQPINVVSWGWIKTGSYATTELIPATAPCDQPPAWTAPVVNVSGAGRSYRLTWPVVDDTCAAWVYEIQYVGFDGAWGAVKNTLLGTYNVPLLTECAEMTYRVVLKVIGGPSLASAPVTVADDAYICSCAAPTVTGIHALELDIAHTLDLAVYLAGRAVDEAAWTLPARAVLNGTAIDWTPRTGEEGLHLAHAIWDPLCPPALVVRLNVYAPYDEPEKPDLDQDGIADDADNCPGTPNRDQADTDLDGLGDACTIVVEAAAPPPPPPPTDIDGDGVSDDADNCPRIANRPQDDQDRDGVGDVCDDDVDGDGVPQVAWDGMTADDALDNCPLTPNTNQVDADGDGVGDACDASIDVPANATTPEANPGPTGPRARSGDLLLSAPDAPMPRVTWLAVAAIAVAALGLLAVAAAVSVRLRRR